mgnify:CR=1 FL=1
MCKKPDVRLARITKEHKKEIIEATHVTVDHLGALARKNLEKLVASDPIHKRLEDLL